MQNRRDFLKTAAFAALGSGLVVRQALAGELLPSTLYINKLGLGGKMKMKFFPYELKGHVNRRYESCSLHVGG